MSKPLAIDLFCGLGGWTDGLLAEGWDVIGFDIERHVYGEHKYPAQLVIQDVLTLHGKQFKNVDLIVASPPCQFFSYTAMPWSKAKALAAEVRADPVRLDKELALFNACFRIQREACEASGRHIPLIVENVRGAIPWVGRSRWNFGSFHLWGDVPALMPPVLKASKNKGGSWFNIGSPGQKELNCNPVHELSGMKAPGLNWSDQTKRGQDFTRHAGRHAAEGIKVPSAEGQRTDKGKGARFTSRDCGAEGRKNGNDWFGSGADCSLQRRAGSKSPARKAASAMIAKIPLPLSRHIAATFKPAAKEQAA